MEQASTESTPKNPYSHHVFLFPFKWDVISQKKRFDEQTFENRCHIDSFETSLTEKPFVLVNDLVSGNRNDIPELQWHRCDYNFGPPDKAPANYNEYTYFYDFVRHSLYDTQGANQEPVRYFELGLVEPNVEQTVPVPAFENATVSFGRLQKKEEKRREAEGIEKTTEVYKIGTFTLKLLSINLHIFNTGVGVLSFFTQNFKTQDEADILLINQLGRRIYPEFLSNYIPTGQEDAESMKGLFPLLINTQLASMLATNVTFMFGQKKADFTYQEYANTTEDPLWDQAKKLPRRIQNFFPGNSFFDDFDLMTKVSDSSPSEGVVLRNIMDDRMFTLCWYGNNKLVRQLKRFDSSTNRYVYEIDKYWFAFVSGDHDAAWPTVQHRQLLQKYIEQYTYGRWANFGTLYGITRELLVVLSDDAESLKKNGAPALYDHVQQMYYQIAVLCLVQRASVLRFTGEITLLTEKMLIRKPEELSKLSNQVSILYRHYIDFLNRLYFREITPQIQGDEIYNQLQTQMETKAEVESAGRQLQELNTYVAAERDKEEAKSSRTISNAINFLAPVSILTGIISFISIDRMDDIEFSKKVSSGFIIYVLVVLVTIIFSKQISNGLIGFIEKLNRIFPSFKRR